MEEYGRAKAGIWRNQGEDDYLVLNAEDSLMLKLCVEDIKPEPRAKIVTFSSKKELKYGAFIKNGKLAFRDEDGSETIFAGTDELRIIGGHNIENALAAVAVCHVSGIDASVIGESLRNFAGVEHRLEFVREKNGVKYYNDSKGTNTDATVTALRAVRDRIVLIAGGDAKSQSFDGLIEEFKGRVKTLLLYGRDAYMIKEACDRHGFTDYELLGSLGECVKKASDTAEAGDKVLLSPACASWDMYPNFEARGEEFKKLVSGL